MTTDLFDTTLTKLVGKPAFERRREYFSAVLSAAFDAQLQRLRTDVKAKRNFMKLLAYKF